MDYQIGINLYRAFVNCLNEGKDKARLHRIESRIDAYYEKLTDPQKTDFCRLLCDQGLIIGPLAAALRIFEGKIVKFA